MANYYLVLKWFSVWTMGNKPVCCQGNLSNSIQYPRIRDILKVGKWSMSASHGGYFPSDAGNILDNRFISFIWHDGFPYSGLSSSDSVTAASFVNSGTVSLTGSGTNFAALNVSGTTTNNGGVSITSDTETLAGAVSGAGSFSLSTANLGFDSTVSAGQTINETGLDGLTLKLAQDFAATINGFGNSGNADTIDATNFAFSGTKYNFVENSAMTGGMLTLTDGTLTANILMTGLYSKSNFSLGHDSGSGTLVSYVA
jgi:hypothetical protein